jgi:type II secretory pathway pseudopilin PulG
VIAIIAVLIALLLPAVQQARAAARRTQNRNNLKQIGIALHNYHDAHRVLPPGWIGADAGVADIEGPSGFGWAAHLLPALEQNNIHSQLDFNLPITDPANSAALATVLPMFLNPNDNMPDFWEIYDEATGMTVLSRLPSCSYVGSFGTRELEDCEALMPGETCTSDGVFFHNSGVRLRDITDGTSNTFVVGERRHDDDPMLDPTWNSTWVGVVAGGQEAFARILGVADHPPNDPSAHLDDFSAEGETGVQFLYGDGRVQFITQSIDLNVYQAQATRAGGEIAAPE